MSSRKNFFSTELLDQFFFCDPVVLESICYRTRANRLKNEGNTTGGLRKIWTGPSNHLLPILIFFCDSVILESLCYHTTANRLIIESNTTRRLKIIWAGGRRHVPVNLKTETYAYQIRLEVHVIEHCRTGWRLTEFISSTASSRPNFYQPSSRIALVYQSVCFCTIADRL